MKKILLSLCLLLSINSFSQENDLVWNTDVNKAIQISLETEKPLFFFFTGSDWCGWCKRLVSEVFNKPEFKKWASKNIVLVDLDFNRAFQKKIQLAQSGKANLTQNENRIIELSQMFSVRGYPTGWFVMPEITADGQISLVNRLGKQGYVAGGPAKWIAGGNKILSNKK
jgi:protein disulfide-isomerase